VRSKSRKACSASRRHKPRCLTPAHTHDHTRTPPQTALITTSTHSNTPPAALPGTDPLGMCAAHSSTSIVSAGEACFGVNRNRQSSPRQGPAGAWRAAAARPLPSLLAATNCLDHALSCVRVCRFAQARTPLRLHGDKAIALQPPTASFTHSTGVAQPRTARHV
jgi:hypothetical protein